MPQSDRTRALDEIVALARQHALTAEEIGAALGASAVAEPDNRGRTVLVRVLGFLGGTFVFAGVGVFIALQWDAMNAAGRVVITLGSGLAAFALAVLSTRDVRFEKASAPLFLVAAALVPTGMLVAFREFGSGGDWHLAGLVTCGTTALQFGAAFAASRRSTPLFIAVLFATLAWGTALDMLDVDGDVIAVILGAALLLAAIGVDRTAHRAVTPPWYLIGAVAFLNGLFDAFKQTPLEIVFLAAAAGFVYLSVAVHSRMLLFVATAAILGYTGWFTGQHFADSVGWPIALIMFGLFMIALSALAFRLDRDYVRVRPARPV
jgi:hypothetical protein